MYFRDITLADESYLVYHDDTDCVLRARKAGQRLYSLTQFKLLHKVSSLSGGGSDSKVRYGGKIHRGSLAALMRACRSCASFLEKQLPHGQVLSALEQKVPGTYSFHRWPGLTGWRVSEANMANSFCIARRICCELE
jgi:hypothetical protein